MKRRGGYLGCSGDAWEKARMRTLVRDNFTCQASALGLPDLTSCSAQHPETKLRKLQVHHKLQRFHGGSHDLTNLITICTAHHMEIHPWMKLEKPDTRPEYEYPLREI